MNPRSTPGASEEAATPAWDPVAVRDLIRQAELEGRHPSRLLLGQKESNAYHNHLATEFGEEALDTVRDNYYLGLEVVELDVPTKLEAVGDKPHHAWEGDLPPLWKEPPQRSGNAA